MYYLLYSKISISYITIQTMLIVLFMFSMKIYYRKKKFMISLKDYFDKVWCSCEVWKWSNEKDKNVKLRFSFPCNYLLGDLIKMIISSNFYSFTQGLLMQSLVFLWGARHFRRIFAKNIRRIFGEYSPQIYSRKH